LFKTEPALGWVSSFCTSIPRQNNKGRWVAGSNPLTSPFFHVSGAYLPLLLYLLQLAKVL
jgi:hypothetical protein